MAGEVTLNIASDQDNAMQFGSLDELAELLRLAGIGQNQTTDVEIVPQIDDVDNTEPSNIETDDNGAFDVEVGDDGSISMPTDENADYDYGHNPTSRKGFIYDVDPYKYQRDGELPTRMVPARSADNPLIRFRENAKSFSTYLHEVEKPKRRKR